MNKILSNVVLSLLLLSIFSCNNSNQKSDTMDTKDTMDNKDSMKIHEEAITYSLNGKTYNGYYTYNENAAGIRPAIIVVPEWWGLNDYARSRAKQLAELGYAAMAIDVYGDGKQGNNPGEAQALATPFYKDPTITKTFIDAAIAKIKTMPNVDTANIGAIGYCFGGFVVLNAAKLGANLKGVVSFHGGLEGVPANKQLIKAKILVCHGAADNFENPHVASFKKDMDDAGIDYEFKEYANATHAFSNPNATEAGKKFDMPIAYNAAADSASWSDMKVFFKNVFGK